MSIEHLDLSGDAWIQLTVKASAIGSRCCKLIFLLWVVGAACTVSLFRESPWTAYANFRDFDAYCLPPICCDMGSTPMLQRVLGAIPELVFLCFERPTVFAHFTAYKLWFFINVLALAITLILPLRDSGLKGAR